MKAELAPGFLPGKCSKFHIMAVLFQVLISATAVPEAPLPGPNLNAIEESIDKLLEHWPVSAADFDIMLPTLDQGIETLSLGYSPALKMHHPTPPTAPKSGVTPQDLAARGGKIVSLFGDLVPWGPDEAPRRPAGQDMIPHRLGSYGIQCLTPVPGKPVTWCDFLILDDERERIHASRFDERNVLRELVLIVWDSGSWRAMEVSLYPDGQPSRLRFWENGKPTAFLAQWKPDRSIQTVPVVDAQYVGGAPVSVCAVTVSYQPPGSTSEPGQARFPMPFAALHIVPTGTEVRIEAPLVSEYQFQGWSGDGSGASPTLNLRPEGGVHLVAHYAWHSEANGQRTRLEPSIEEAVRRQIGKPKEPLTSSDLLSIISLELPGTQPKEIGHIRHLKSLRKLSLVGTPVQNLLFLSRHSAIEGILKSPTVLAQTDLLNRVLLSLNAGIAPSVDTLAIQDVNLSNRHKLQYLDSIVHLSLRNTNLRDLEFLGGLKNLESLDVSQNRIADLSPLAYGGPCPKLIVATDNQISDLGPLAMRKSWPAEMTLDIRGNALSPESVCTVVPTLEALGISLTFDGACAENAPHISAEDGDDDGYTNREEWQFVSLFSALETERNARFDAAIADATIPRTYMANLSAVEYDPDAEKVPIDSIPITQISLDISGQGTVYPGKGVHNFAQRVFNADGTWDWNWITFQPIAEPDWEFVPLDGWLFESQLVRRLESGTDFQIEMSAGLGLMINFRKVQTP